MKHLLRLLSVVFVSLLLTFAGCGKSGEEKEIVVKTPEQAATVLDESFAAAAPDVKQNVTIVSEALRKREYEKAIASLYNVQQAPSITLQQGMAIHNSSVMLEHELINAMENGDAKAAQAYQLLKRMKRN